MDAHAQPQQTAVIYARTSKEYKNVERVSIPQQIEDGRRLAADLNCNIAGVYVDEDRSSQLPPRQLAKPGQKKTREGLSNLLDCINDGGVQIIIARKGDRLSRVYEMSRDLYRYLDERRIAPAFTHEMARNTKDAAGRFSFNMMALVADYELERIRENVKASKDYARRHGLKMGPVWTLGYQDGSKKGTIEVRLDAVPVVLEAFQRVDSGDSVMNICRWMTAEHSKLCKPKSGTVNPFWQAVSVRRILTNRRYVGLNPDGSKSTLYEPIIPADLFWRVQEKLACRRVSPYAKRRQHNRPLRGLLRCGCCGQNLRTVCMSGKQAEIKLYGCLQTIQAHPWRPFMMRESRWFEFIRVFFVRDLAPNIESKESALLKAQLGGIEAKMSELAALLGKDLSTKAYAVAVKELEKHRNKLAAQLNNLPAKQGPFDPNDWHGLGDEEKRQLLLSFVDRIIVYRDHCDVYRADAPEVPFRFPAMKERKHATRAISCLCPSGFKRSDADEILLGIEHRLDRLTGKPDPKEYATKYVAAQWKPWLSGKFYPAVESGVRLVSRRARKRRGLPGGKNYPGRKKARGVLL